MFKCLNKAAVHAAGLILCLGGSLPQARAEGSKALEWTGAWGVNRVIRTEEGYYAISSVADISFFMPSDTDPDNGVQVVTRDTNPFDNKPSAYVGGDGAFYKETNGQVVNAGRAEVDAGLQFETGVWRTSTTPGWSAFISNGNSDKMPAPSGEHFTYIRVWDDVNHLWKPWRDAVATTWSADLSTGSAKSRMQFEITTNRQAVDSVDQNHNPVEDPNTHLLISDTATANGEAKLILPVLGRKDASSQITDVLNTCYWNQEPRFENPDRRYATDQRFGYRVSPWIGQQIFNTARLAEATVKRVVAMTRANPSSTSGATPAYSDLDGSNLTCTFTFGKVAPVGSGLVDWQQANVDQARTGYDTPPDNATAPAMAYDMRWPWTRVYGSPIVTPEHRFTMYSRSLVEFSAATTRPDYSVAFDQTYNWNARADVHDPNRYIRETVRINLRTVTRPTGSAVEAE